MISVVVALIASAVGLIVGSIVSKVYFTARVRKNSLPKEAHQELMAQQGQQYQEKITSLHNQARLKNKQLGEKGIEKDKEIAKLLSEACDQSSADSSAKKLVDILRTEIAGLRENLDDRDQRLSELKLEVRDSQSKAAQYLTELNSWKEQVAPLSGKLQKQEQMIQTLEDEMTSETMRVRLQEDVIQALAEEVTATAVQKANE
jgi:uncharacterized protein YneF (UPF0154 family)